MKRIELEPGSKYGLWTVKGDMEVRNHKLYYLCVCECGIEVYVYSGNLRRGGSSACRKCAQKHRLVPLELKRKRENDRARERYATDPAYAKRKRDKARKYGEDNREKVNARVRKWSSENKDQIKKYRQENKEKAAIVAREWALKSFYGLSLDDYDKMYTAQEGVCAICSQAGKRSLCVDHCHTTGKVRALLCDSCNRGIGMLKEDTSVLQAAIAYLNRHKEIDDLQGQQSEVGSGSPEGAASSSSS